ncbi:hypothetical protein TGMAS_246700 [Toxoplasma gondii MAS]|uniref:Uncharacterized protein n=3 Tax=Toxoplasma gondii TaxID=5811 RepID=A0A2G8YBT2_TOXGO|nr:hypothetical protein TGMAS_246700 [Toxoplasma gondii MAS]PIM04728.1 hypothetical protein TGCOUG_246700 [Toxoplasma gondii COUG]PUA90539.1 hypothetical protein TGBR9_246700 [Toxoplasma gondii TgCATBr9]
MCGLTVLRIQTHRKRLKGLFAAAKRGVKRCCSSQCVFSFAFLPTRVSPRKTPCYGGCGILRLRSDKKSGLTQEEQIRECWNMSQMIRFPGKRPFSVDASAEKLEKLDRKPLRLGQRLARLCKPLTFSPVFARDPLSPCPWFFCAKGFPVEDWHQESMQLEWWKSWKCAGSACFIQRLRLSACVSVNARR